MGRRKHGSAGDLSSRGDKAEQRQVLAALADRPWPTPAEIPSTPLLAVECFFTPGELCDLMQQVQALVTQTKPLLFKIILEDGAELGLELPALDPATVATLVEAAQANDKLALPHMQTRAAAAQALAADTDGLAHIFWAVMNIGTW